jgi:hypothetical protein
LIPVLHQNIKQMPVGLGPGRDDRQSFRREKRGKLSIVAPPNLHPLLLDAKGSGQLGIKEGGLKFIRVWFLGALSESAFSLRFSPPTIVGEYR